tara:strand:+ start:28831 stop:29712 length:882 start_codon:yes stop_codon:yes gene_type:complete
MYPYQNSYEAIALRSYAVDKIISGLRLAKADRQLAGAETEGFGHVLTVVDKHSDLPFFAHPIVDGGDVYVDVRPLISVVSQHGDYRVKERAEYNFRVLRAAMELRWAESEDYRDQLTSISDLPLELYCKWFSENITRRLGLDAETQAILAGVAGFFYLSCVEKEMNDRVWQRNVAIVARVTRIPAGRLTQMFPDPISFQSLDELAMYMANEMDNPRLGKMNVGLLFSILTPGWFTHHGPEVMGVALEMPVTWMACVYHAVGDRALRNSNIGRLLQRTKADPAQYQRAILSLLR